MKRLILPLLLIATPAAYSQTTPAYTPTSLQAEATKSGAPIEKNSVGSPFFTQLSWNGPAPQGTAISAALDASSARLVSLAVTGMAPSRG